MHRIVLNHSEKPEYWRVFPRVQDACRWALDNYNKYSTMDLYWIDDKDATPNSLGVLVGTFSVEGILYSRPFPSTSELQEAEPVDNWHMYLSLAHVFTCAFVFLSFASSMIEAIARRINRHYSQ